MTTGPFTEQTLMTVIRESVGPSLVLGHDAEIRMDFETNTFTLRDVSTPVFLAALNKAAQEAQP